MLCTIYFLNITVIFLCDLLLGGNSNYANAKICSDNNDGNDHASSCRSLRQLESNDGKALASASTNDGTNENNLDTSGNHGSSNHDFGKDHNNDENHRRGGSEHLSKDDTPFSLPFP